MPYGLDQIRELVSKAEMPYNGDMAPWQYYQLVGDDGVTPIAYYRFNGWQADAFVDGQWQPSFGFLDELNSGDTNFKRLAGDPTVAFLKSVDPLVPAPVDTRTLGLYTLNQVENGVVSGEPQGIVTLTKSIGTHRPATLTATGAGKPIVDSMRLRLGTDASDEEIYSALADNWTNGHYFSLLRG